MANLYICLRSGPVGATLETDSSSLVPLNGIASMSNPPQLPPGQRWRSLVDGHTVITGAHATDGMLWIQYDNTRFATAMEPADFVDGYEFVETVSQPVPAA